MDKLIAQFPEQILEALSIGENSVINKHSAEIKNILVSGLGGSGIGGTIVQELVSNSLKIPFSVSKKYTLPSYINENSLVIISSYSGNTEETVEALQIAISKNAKIVGITSGGKIADICKQNNIDLILLPAGKPSPRACLGYSLIQQFYIIHKLGFINDSFKNDLISAKSLIENEEKFIHEFAKDLAQKLYDKTPIIYSADHQEGVAIRWRQQINENAKMLCWHHAIPEMNHNELVGWRTEDSNLSVIILRNSNDYNKIQKRIEINKQIFTKYTPNIYEIWSKGNNPIEQSIYLINLGDWLSFYLSEKRNFNAIEIDVINYLKASLAK
jgi:glucose/mannose-6-phosphate isomerase